MQPWLIQILWLMVVTRFGGLGANFIVEWVAQTEVSEPVIEAIMIGSSFQQGISWISPGKVIKNQNNRSPETSLSGF